MLLQSISTALNFTVMPLFRFYIHFLFKLQAPEFLFLSESLILLKSIKLVAEFSSGFYKVKKEIEHYIAKIHSQLIE